MLNSFSIEFFSFWPYFKNATILSSCYMNSFFLTAFCLKVILLFRIKLRWYHMKTLYEIKDKYLTESNIEKISYLIFGGFTTLINLVSYWFFAYVLNFNYMIASIFAWVFAVAFAFITNKLFVFKSYSKNLSTLLKETISFFTFRILSLFMDLGTMFLCVQIIKMHSLIAKIIANIIVIIFNYFASKFIIFKK